MVCVIAGLGAGFGTGLAGHFAATVILPMQITLLHVNAYKAVGTVLPSDILASDLTGSVSHFVIGGGVTDYSILLLYILFMLLGALFIAKFTNKASPRVMNRTLGFGSLAMSIAMILIDSI